MLRLLCLLIFLPAAAQAEIIVAARTIPAQTVLAPSDLLYHEGEVSGGVSNPDLLIGMETRVALYAGRPVRLGDVGPPAIVERNQLIRIIFNTGGLYIATQGRALERAGVGEVIRIMNLSSRNTISALIGEDGSAYATQ